MSTARGGSVARSSDECAKEQQQTLEESVTHLLEEGRMLLPGIQALFGFQLISVFNATFYDRLVQPERYLHLAAIALVALCMALVLAPAAYHRQATPRSISEAFLRYSSQVFAVALAFLMCAVAMDFYIIARVISDQRTLSAVIAANMFLCFVMLWFAVPWWTGRRKRKSD
jgi:hypothetical protein